MSCETKHPISSDSVQPLLNERFSISPTCDPDPETYLCTLILCQSLHLRPPSLLGEVPELSYQAIIIRAAASAALVTMSSNHSVRTSPRTHHIKKTGVKAVRPAPVSKGALKGNKVKPAKSEEELVDSFDDDDMGCSFLQFWYAVTRLPYAKEHLTHSRQCNV